MSGIQQYLSREARLTKKALDFSTIQGVTGGTSGWPQGNAPNNSPVYTTSRAIGNWWDRNVAWKESENAVGRGRAAEKGWNTLSPYHKLLQSHAMTKGALPAGGQPGFWEFAGKGLSEQELLANPKLYSNAKRILDTQYGPKGKLVSPTGDAHARGLGNLNHLNWMRQNMTKLNPESLAIMRDMGVQMPDMKGLGNLTMKGLAGMSQSELSKIQQVLSPKSRQMAKHVFGTPEKSSFNPNGRLGRAYSEGINIGGVQVQPPHKSYTEFHQDPRVGGQPESGRLPGVLQHSIGNYLPTVNQQTGKWQGPVASPFHSRLKGEIAQPSWNPVTGEASGVDAQGKRFSRTTPNYSMPGEDLLEYGAFRRRIPDWHLEERKMTPNEVSRHKLWSPIGKTLGNVTNAVGTGMSKMLNPPPQSPGSPPPPPGAITGLKTDTGAEYDRLPPKLPKPPIVAGQ